MRSAASTLFAFVLSLGACAAHAQHLVASSTQGILRVRPSGSVAEVVSSTPTSYARMRGTDRVVLLVEGTNELRELDLANRTERTIATLPGDTGLGGGQFGDGTGGDAGEPYLVAAHLHFDESMVVGDTLACFEVMDRNLNMASVVATIAVDLRTGAITRHVVLSEHCGVIEGEEWARLPCNALFDAARRARGQSGPLEGLPWSLAADESSAALVGPRGRRRALALTEPLIERASADGRWAVLSGNRDGGDYIYRDILLFDRRSGAVHPLPDAAPWTWRPALPDAAIADARALTERATSVSGETSLVWIENGRSLLVGSTLLVRPGRRGVFLPGALVW